MKKIATLLYILFILLPGFSQAHIELTNLTDGEEKSGLFTIYGTLTNGNGNEKVCIKINDGPWETVSGTDSWDYDVNYRDLVINSEYRYDPVTNQVIRIYERGILYGDVSIIVAALAPGDCVVTQEELTIRILPETPVSDTPSGYFNDDVNINLDTNPELSIYYTLNGSNPITSGVLYSGQITVSDTSTLCAVAISDNDVASEILELDIIIDRTGPPSFDIQYYSDSELTVPLGDNPFLKAGVYYIKIQASKLLKNNPTISIDAEGTNNDVSDDTTTQIDDYNYLYTRTITGDVSATGDTLEDVSITGTDMVNNVSQDVSPLNESEKAAYTDTTPPETGIIQIDDISGYTNDPTPYLNLDSGGASFMRFALSEPDLSAAEWVTYASGYDGFNISASGTGSKTIWVEFMDAAGNIQAVHTSDTTYYDDSVLSYDIEYFEDIDLTIPMGSDPCLRAGTYYLKITTNNTLGVTPTINIDAEGTDNDVIEGEIIFLGGTVYRYTRTIVSSPDAVGSVREEISILLVAPSNQASNAAFTDTVAPVVDAGPDIPATNDISSLNADSSDVSPLAYLWEKIGGTGTVSFGNEFIEDTTIEGADNEEGVFTIRLTVVDAAGNSASDTLTFTWDKKGPEVDAGVDIPWTRDFANLNGSATDLSGISEYTWSKTGGTGTVSFGDETEAITTVIGSAGEEQVFTLTLTATDTVGNSASDTLSFSWDSKAPEVDAGEDIPWTRDYANLNGSATDLSGISEYTWSKTGGTGTVIFDDETQAITTVFGSAGEEQVFTLTLTATDTVGNSASDTLSFSWDSKAPEVDAGEDIPWTNSPAGLDATVTDTNACTVLWENLSPGTVTFVDDHSEDTTIQGVSGEEGTYTIQLTATDSLGNSASDTLSFNWDALAPSAPSVSVTGDTWGSVNNNDILPLQNVVIVLEDNPSYTHIISFEKNYQSATYPVTNQVDEAGYYNLSVQFRDQAGNLSSATTRYWRIIDPIIINVNDSWIEGNIDEYGEQEWYSFDAVAGESYLISWDSSIYGSGVYTGNIRVSAYYDDLETIYFGSEADGYNTPDRIDVTTSGKVYISVRGFGYTNYGTYALRVYQEPDIALYEEGTKISNNDTSDFGNIFADIEFQTYEYEIRNTGTGELNISNIVSDNPTDFYLDAIFPVTIQPNESRTFTVRYFSSSAGTHTGTLQVVSDDPDTPTMNINLYGECTAITEIDRSDPSGIDDSVSSSTEIDWYYVNCFPGGSFIITWDDYFHTGSGYTGRISVSAYETDKTTAFFEYEIGGYTIPQIITTDEDMFYIKVQRYSVYNGTYNIKVGQGPFVQIAGINDGGSFTFPDIVEGYSSDYETFTITNKGSEDLLISSEQLSNTIDFWLTPVEDTWLSTGESTTFRLYFTPDTAGIKTATYTLEVFEDAFDNETYVINLSGTGLTAEPEIEIRQGITVYDNNDTYDFGSILYNTTTATDISIYNTGTKQLLLTGSPVVELGGTNADEFTMDISSLDTSISSGSSSSFSISFNPTSSGSKSAVLTIYNDDADENPTVINLTGTATAPEIGILVDAIVQEHGSIIDYGDVWDTKTRTITFTVNNTGTGDLILTDSPPVYKSGLDTSEFIIDQSSLGSTIPPGAESSFTVTVDPVSIGSKTIQIGLDNNDADEFKYILILTANIIDGYDLAGQIEWNYNPDAFGVYNASTEQVEWSYNPNAFGVYNPGTGTVEWNYNPDAFGVYNASTGQVEWSYNPNAFGVYNPGTESIEWSYNPDAFGVYNASTGQIEWSYNPNAFGVYNWELDEVIWSYNPDAFGVWMPDNQTEFALYMNELGIY